MIFDGKIPLRQVNVRILGVFLILRDVLLVNMVVRMVHHVMCYEFSTLVFAKKFT